MQGSGGGQRVCKQYQLPLPRDAGRLPKGVLTAVEMVAAHAGAVGSHLTEATLAAILAQQ